MKTPKRTRYDQVLTDEYAHECYRLASQQKLGHVLKAKHFTVLDRFGPYRLCIARLKDGWLDVEQVLILTDAHRLALRLMGAQERSVEHYAVGPDERAPMAVKFLKMHRTPPPLSGRLKTYVLFQPGVRPDLGEVERLVDYLPGVGSFPLALHFKAHWYISPSLFQDGPVFYGFPEEDPMTVYKIPRRCVPRGGFVKLWQKNAP